MRQKAKTVARDARYPTLYGEAVKDGPPVCTLSFGDGTRGWIPRSSPLLCELGDGHGMGFAGVGVEAAPGPVFGLLDRAGGNGVLVHVVELLDDLVVLEDIEVVVARFPDELCCAGAGEALFHDLDGGGEFGFLWLGEE